MKKPRMAAFVLCACLLLAACKRSDIAQNVGPALDDFQGQPAPAPEAREVGIVTKDGPDFTDPLGFALTSLPSGEDMTPYKYFALDGWYAQVEFEAPDGWALVLRVARAGEKYLSATWAEGHRAGEESLDIDGIPVRLRTDSDGCALVTWERGGFQFALHSSRRRGMPPEEWIEQAVRGAYAEETAQETAGSSVRE